MHLRSLAYLALPAALLLSVASSSDAALKAQAGAKIEFRATGPAGLKITGKGKELKVQDDAETVTVTVPLAQLETGIGLRDSHMRDKYLEVKKFPEAVLVVKKADVKFPAGGSGEAQGTLTLHGKSKPVSFKYNAKKSGERYQVSGSLSLKLDDFGIDKPSFAGATVRPDIDVDVEFQALDN